MPTSPTQVANGIRALLLSLCFMLALISGSNRVEALTWFPVLVGLATVSAVRSWHGNAGDAMRVVESAGTVVAVLETGAGASPLFLYLLAPAFIGGLARGASGAVLPPGFAALALVAGGAIDGRPGGFAVASAEWTVLALAAGLTAAWIRTLRSPSGRAPEQLDTTYAAAYRLLAQLRPVARQLSVGLDAPTIAEGLLQTLHEVCPFHRGAVYVRTGGGRLIPLAATGAERLDWDVAVGGEGPFAEAWLTQRPQRLPRTFAGGSGSALVLPLVIGLRTFGLVGLDSDDPTLMTGNPTELAGLVEEAALRLETALLFDEVRGVATAEERRRLAREIHDGIAQELSSIGYLVDGLAADARDGTDPAGVVRQLQDLRTEITRIVSELRLSIFDLRSDVDTHGGLGAALSEYVRTVGRQSGLTVHLSLSEGASRLPAETEAELLRIAQEAVTNCRRHAGAQNIWVTLEVSPPSAVLRVEDDGRGLGRSRTDSYGLAIMRERARRLRTSLRVESREPQGTLVEVRLSDRTKRTRLATMPAASPEELEPVRRSGGGRS